MAAAGSKLRRRKRSDATGRDDSSPVSGPSDLDPAGKNRPSQNLRASRLLAHLSASDLVVASLLLAAASGIRFYRLAHPAAVVFDETHYLKFSTWVLSSEFFFDVNPPFGKWIIAVVARAFGFAPASSSEFSSPQVPMSSATAFAARAPSAIFGSLTVPIFYFLCRQLRLSVEASAIGACFILFDSMHVIQSRMAMVDSLLVFFTCVALLFALLLWDAKRISILKGQQRTVSDFIVPAALLVIAGIFSGLSVSIRWTAFATPALVLIVSLFGVPPFCLAPLGWLEVVVLAGSMFAAYYASFVVFLRTVHKSGSGDLFMSPEFQMCLLGSQPYTDAVKAGAAPMCELSMWARFVELNEKIFSYSKGIRGADKWGSTWFQWIINWRGALYYSKEYSGASTDAKTGTALVYTLMNPAMVATIDGLMGIFGSAVCYCVRYRKRFSLEKHMVEQMGRGCVLFFGWMLSMLPTMVVYRSGPVYQYLPGLFFAQGLGALAFDIFIPRGAAQRVLGVFICTFLVAAFVYWSPWCYATQLSMKDHKARRWLPRWD